MQRTQVRVWETTVDIPTYGVGTPNKNPMFLEKRIYQGSSGRVYPYPVIDKIEDTSQIRTHRVVILENDYLHIEIMPDLGGRIYRALDKTNQYDFVYYNRVIKPALVGLAGPWISGGIEFNWPQHHRPNTFGPVSCSLEEREDGSGVVWVHEIDRMYGTEMTAGFTLYPDKAYLEIAVRLYNRTSQPQTFLWWANPAVAANDHTQTVFPPDVHFVFDHGKRDVSRFPIATGTYYKRDYSAGVDISQHKNIEVPTSYMAHHSDYDFVGGYDHALRAGILHIANHHVSPGKKQWTWGNGAFGHAWDRNLTDEDGSYVELMAGVYTDNQPDFSWLQPFEEKTFQQYFLPYKEIGLVKNASIDAALNLDVDTERHEARLQVYATAYVPQASIELVGQKQVYLHETTTLSPSQTFQTTISLEENEQSYDLVARVKDQTGKLLISYRPARPAITPMPAAAQALPKPEQMSNTEALYLAGLHLEQYRHATFEPTDYYREGLRRDPGDSRLNVAYGRLLLRQGNFQESERHFRTAIATLTRHNPNPYDSEAYYQLGVALKLLGRNDEAFDALYKATWTDAWKDSSFLLLAQLASARGVYAEALALLERALARNRQMAQAHHLKIVLLRKLGKIDEAIEAANTLIRSHHIHFGAYYELQMLYDLQGDSEQAKTARSTLDDLLRSDIYTIMALAHDYAHYGCYDEGISILLGAVGDGQSPTLPLVYYTLGYFYEQAGDAELARLYRQKGRAATPDYCFPNSLDDLLVLESTIAAEPADARAQYYLGNLLYDKKRYDEAIFHWEQALRHDGSYAVVPRNLALAYYNKKQQPEQAFRMLELACATDPTDARILYELDQLAKRMNQPLEQRLARLDAAWPLVLERDDLYLEYVTLLNTLRQHERARQLLSQRIFHPWEGGEGKVTGQYVLAQVEIGKRQLAAQQANEAIETLRQALEYPENLGEGKLAGAQENNIYYFLGCAYEQLHQTELARSCFQRAGHGLEEPSSALFYNDQPPDMIFYQGLAWRGLGDEEQARSRFHKLIDYGEQHLFQQTEIDYFAVSLPDFLVFEDDINLRNREHCQYMLGLGYLGMRNREAARTHFQRVLALNNSHQGAKIHLELCDSMSI